MAIIPLEKQNIVVIGASGHASVIIDIIERQNLYTIVGLIDSYKPVGSKIFDYEVLGNEDSIPDLINKHNIIGGIIAIGNNYDRYQVYLKVKELCSNFKYIKAIHPDAIIGKDVVVNEGSAVMAGVIVNANAYVGPFTILNTGATLGHDCMMSKFSSIAPGVNIAGNVSLKKCSSVGIGSCVVGGLSIGKHSHVGAGSTVVTDIDSYKIAYGNPAREIRTCKKSTNYLRSKKA